MSPTHSRVAAGSLVLLTPGVARSNSLPASFFATNQPVATARLRSGLTTIIAAGPLQAQSAVDYALSQGRPVCVLGDETDALSYADALARPVRIVSPDNVVFLSSDLSDLDDPIVIFGDLHQCWRTYEEFKREAIKCHGENVLLVSVGDLFDKGGRDATDVIETARVLMRDVADGNLVIATGNHDATLATRLARHFSTPAIERSSNTHRTVRALTNHSAAFAQSVMHWLQALPLFVRLAPDAVAVHASWNPELSVSAPNSRQFKEACLYGPRPAAGESRYDERGRYVWVDWALDYQGPDRVYHGHHSDTQVRVNNNVVALDTGCSDGGVLTGILLGADPYNQASYLRVAAHESDLHEPAPAAL